MKAIITGGSRGIGLEITRQLRNRGWDVHVLSRSGMPHPPEGVTSWQVDIGDLEAAQRIFDQIGPIQVLVNGAGVMHPRTVLDYPQEELRSSLATNLIAAVQLSARTAQQMAQSGGGRIVSLGSIAGEIGHPDIWYGIAKAGLMNAMRSLARTFGPSGVIANAVAPGPVETDMMRNIPEDRKLRLKAATITQRFCTAEEVAQTVCWLATEAPACINGEIIDMNNGANYR